MPLRLAPLLALAAACAVDPSGLPGDGDGGPQDFDADVDMAGVDARPPPDQGPVDMQPVDEGVDMLIDEVDLGTDLGVDLGIDMGVDLGIDMGIDMGPPDMGPPDMGPPDMGPPDMGGCVPQNETCNATDDDCDGNIDEDPGGPRGQNICPDPCVRAVSPGGVTYQICPIPATWARARDLCRFSGYELASPETMAEDDFLDSVLVGGDDYWIALNDRDTEGTFEWEDQPTDRPLGAFNDWDPATSEPNGGDSDDCVRIDLGTLRWRDSDCSGFSQDTHYFACEAP